MKMPSGKRRSTRKLSIDEQAAERAKLIKPVRGDREFEEREQLAVHHIASKHSHRRNPFAA